VPLPRVHQVRYGGCLGPPSDLRGAILPTLRQQRVVEDEETDTGRFHWSWARLLQRSFAPALVRGNARSPAARWRAGGRTASRPAPGTASRGLHNPEGACPTGLRHYSVCNAYTLRNSALLFSPSLNPLFRMADFECVLFSEISVHLSERVFLERGAHIQVLRPRPGMRPMPGLLLSLR
jgi:hypothetical protein